jgi:hypothetical protein
MNGNSPYCRATLESEVIGACMNAAALGESVPPLKPARYTSGLHRAAATVISELVESGESPNLVQVTRRIADNIDPKLLPEGWHATLSEWEDAAILPLGEYLPRLEAEHARDQIDTAIERARKISDPVKFSEAIARISELTERVKPQADKAAKIRAMLEVRRVKHDDPPPEPVPVFLLNGTRISTAGNLLVPSGQAKAGKTAVLSAIAAAAMGARWECDTLGFTAAPNPEGKALVWIDTEQSPWDAWKVLHAACNRAGLSEPPPWVRMYCLTDLSPAERREALRVSLADAAQACGGIFAFIVDGCADLVFGVNDEREALELAGELHALAIQYAAPGICNLHENPGSEIGKTRGHLGSQLERKAETNLKVKKNEAEESLVYAPKNRGPSIPEAGGTWFKWDGEAGMHTTFRKAPTRPGKEESARLQAEGIFGRDSVLSTAEILTRSKAAGTNLKTAERRIAEWVERRAVEKLGWGEYKIIPSPKTLLE